jgi:hypothetical protein
MDLTQSRMSMLHSYADKEFDEFQVCKPFETYPLRKLGGDAHA